MSDFELKDKTANETTIKLRPKTGFPTLDACSRWAATEINRTTSGNQPPPSIFYDLRPVADSSRCHVADGTRG
jgi:hypothetical protein